MSGNVGRGRARGRNMAIVPPVGQISRATGTGGGRGRGRGVPAATIPSSGSGVLQIARSESGGETGPGMGAGRGRGRGVPTVTVPSSGSRVLQVARSEIGEGQIGSDSRSQNVEAEIARSEDAEGQIGSPNFPGAVEVEGSSDSNMQQGSPTFNVDRDPLTGLLSADESQAINMENQPHQQKPSVSEEDKMQETADSLLE